MPNAPLNLNLSSQSDSGFSNSDKLTKTTKPTITGQAQAGSTVTLYDGTVVVGSVVVPVNGSWSIQTSLLSGEGLHTLTATATLAGETSVVSDPLALTIDTVAPDRIVDAPNLSAGSDTGISNDNVTQNNRPVFAGQLETVEGGKDFTGYSINLYDGAKKVGTASLSGTGVWIVGSNTALVDGIHNMGITLVDKAGNESALSDTRQIQIITHADPASAPFLLPAEDKGSSSSDHITSANIFSFSGTAPIGTKVHLLDFGIDLGTVIVDASGHWKIEQVVLTEGEHRLTSVVEDIAKNMSAPSAPLQFTIDNTAPDAVAAPVLAPGSDTGSAPDDNLTNLATPTLTGVTEAGATVALYEGDTLLGTAVADADGTWNVTSAALADGFHNLTVRVTDVAGNTSQLSDALTVIIDTEAPAASGAPVLDRLDDSGVSDADGVTNIGKPHLSGKTEAGATVALFDGDVAIGSTVADANGAWSFDKASISLGEGAHVLTVKATDAAGNTSGASAALHLTVDTTAPDALPAPDLAAGSDSGVSNTDNITNDNQPLLRGHAEAGATVVLFDGETRLGTTVADAGGNWTIASSALADGVHRLTVGTTDVAGNTSAASNALTLTVDTAAPDAPTPLGLTAASDSGASDHDNVTNAASPAVTGKAEAGATVTLFDGATKLGTAVADGAGVWTIFSDQLSDGVHHLTASATDAAGNASTLSSALVVTVDRAAPLAPAAPELAAQSDSGAAADNLTNHAAPQLQGTAEAGASVALFDGDTQVGSGVADADGAWTITAATLADGAHSLTVKATDAAGNVSAASPALALTIDTRAPDAPADLDLLAGSDSGASDSDNITNATLPVIAGSAEAGSTVALFDGATQIGSVVADGGGHWQITPAQALGNGVHTLSATATDAAGNVSAASQPLSITIDSRAAVTPSALALTAETDSGASNQDGITNATAPGVTGKAEAGATINLFDGATKLGTAVADDAGVWTVAGVELAEGVHHLTASSSSLTGTVSAPSTELVVTIDRTAPQAPAAPALAAASDSGAQGDGITNVATPALHGSAEAGASVALFDGDTQVGSGVADADGAWSISAGALADGAHSLTVKATDAAGNVSLASAALALTVDTKAPDAPTELDLVAGSDTGVSDSDNITGDTTPTITGRAEAGSTVVLSDGLVRIGTTVADETGHWEFTPASALAFHFGGLHNLSAKAVDAAGNTSAGSTLLKITVDTSVPVTPTNLNLADSADSGVSNTDNITNATTPTITGNAAAGATVTLFEGAVKLATVVANDAGVWSVDNVALADGVHHLTASASSLAGAVSEPSAELVLTIDSKAPSAPPAPALAALSDSGAADNLTNHAAPQVQGTAEAGASVALFDGAKLVGSGVADINGAWTITADTLADGVHQLTVKATDAAGNVSGASPALSVTIDTKAPDAPANLDLLAVSDSGVSDSDNITDATLPVIAGSAEAGSTVALFDGATRIGSIVADGNGHWQIAPAQALGNGVHNLTATATDVAGNVSAASQPLSITIDTGTAHTPTDLDLADGFDSGVSNQDNITSAATPVITGKADAGASVTLFDGATKLGTVVANDAGVWRVDNITFADGVHHLTASTSTLAGAVSAPSAELVVTIDTKAPGAPGTPDLVDGSDKGVSNTDNITNVTLPTLAGTAEANSQVALYEGATLLGSVKADASGNWQITVTQPLAAGLHSLTATATDAAGNTSPVSGALGVTIATAALTAPSALDLAAASDSGASSIDNITSATTPLISGKADIGATVTLFDGQTQVGTATANASGAWSLNTGALGDGVHHLTAVAADAAGNVSSASAELVVTVDTTAPVTTLAVAAASDSGRSGTDGVTNDTTPLVTGTTEANAAVVLFDGVKQVGTGTADANGVFNITSTALAAGAHSLTIKATDLAGNVSTSPALAVTIDVTAPTAPATPDLTDLSDKGASSTDNLTNATLPTFAGKAEANAIVSLYDGTAVVGTGVADDNGNWQIAPTKALLDGSHSITVTATDVAGNVSGKSAALTVVIETVAPAAPSALDLATTSDKGVSSTDNVTNIATPGVSGRIAASSSPTTVNLYDGDTVVGTVVVAANVTTWTLPAIAKLADGEHHLTATATDTAGNVSALSGELLVTIDTAAPNAPGALVLDPLSDSGASTADFLTNVTTPHLTGTAEAGATVTLFDGATAVGSAVADATGAWSLNSSALLDGAHSLTVKATDVAGNVSAASPALTLTVDTVIAQPAAPDLLAGSDTGPSSTDNNTSVTTPTLAGKTEANASVSLYEGLVLVGSGVADANGNWEIKVAQPLSDGLHSLSVQVTDLAGNVSIRSGALGVTVDTTAPLSVPSALDLVATSDKGSSSVDNITNFTTPSLTGKITTTVATTVGVFDGDTLVGSVAVAANATTWTLPATIKLTDGEHHLTARAIDTAGNMSAPSAELVVTIDTAAPVVTSAPLLSTLFDSGRSDSDNITSSRAPLLTGTTEVGATVTLFDGTTQLLSTTAGTDGAWSITPTGLLNGVHNLTVKVTDVAGNVSAASPALALTVDYVAPAAPTIVDLLTASDSGASSTDNLTNINLPTLSGKAELNAIVSLYDGAVLVGTGVADAVTGAWQITLNQPLADGTRSLTAKATDVAGNVSPVSTAFVVKIDTVTAAPTELALAAGSDLGVSPTDNLTNVAAPAVTGKAELGATVNLYDGATLLGTATASASTGVWTIQANTKLTDGVHQLTAVATDLAGNVSTLSGPLAVTIDTAAPNAPGALALDPLSDSGASKADAITNITTPHLSGSAEAGSTVTLFDNGVALAVSAVADATGAWSLNSSALLDGVHNLTVKATDAAGNVSAASPALALTVDTVIAQPAAPDLLAGSDTGALSTDNNTSITTPTLAGKTEANASVSLYEGTVLVGSGVADANGNWEVKVAQPLSDGLHSLSVQVIDVAGNVSVKSGALGVTIDTTAPLSVPSGLDLVTASDRGSSNVDNITNFATPSLTGKITTTVATTVGVFDGDTLVGSVAVAANATSWTLPATIKLTDGEHHLTARAIDTAGNLSAPSAELVVTIDTAAPVITIAPDLATAFDSGRSDSDNITSSRTPSITGTTEAGATVTLFDGTTQLLSTTAGADGAWSITTAALATGLHNLTVKVTDVAGNISAASPVLALTVDFTVPATPVAPDLAATSDSGTSTVDNITAIATPTLTGKAELNAIVSLYDGAVLVGTGLADPVTGVWQITLTQPLADGSHQLSVTATDVAGNTTVKSGALTVVVDTAEAAPSALDLQTDSGVSATDNLTNVVTPTITGNAATGSVVKLYDGATLVGSFTAVNGAWSIATSALSDGVHHLTASATDIAGNVSALSDELVVTIDATAPALGALVLDPSSDSGSSKADGITNDTTPLLTGTAEKGAAVTLFDGTTLIGSAVADDNGVWSIASGTLVDGKHSLTAKATDAAGNTASSTLSVTVDTVIAQPGLPDLATASDNGKSTTDNVTGITAPLITGKAEIGSTVTLLDGGVAVGSAVADASGNWQVQLKSVSEGVHVLTSQATDIAGNVSVPSAALTVTVDSHADKPGLPDLADASDSGASKTDNITNVATSVLNGTAEAGSSVTLRDGETVLATVVASATGAWTYSKAFTAGAHSITATATDLVGNVSERSDALVLTLDTSAATPAAPVLAASSDSGVSASDRNTSDSTPLLTGTTTEKGATISLYEGTKLLGTTVSDIGTGAWTMTSPTLADGAHSLTVKATDLAGNVSAASAALVVTIDTLAPALTDANTAGNMVNPGTEKAGGLVGVTATGAAAGTYVLTSNPGDLFVIDKSSGVVTLASGAALTSGAHNVTVQGTDLAGNIGFGDFTIFGNTAPTISAIANATFGEDTRPTLAFTVGDGETPLNLLSVTASSATGLISGFSFTNNGGSRGITLVPSANASGTDTITVTVTDSGGLKSSTSFNVKVTPVDDTSIPLPDVFGGRENGGVTTMSTASLLQNDVDIDSPKPSLVTSVSSVSGGTASLSGTTVTFRSDTGSHGLGHYSYTVADGGTGDVWIKLAPIANDDDYTYEIQQMYVGYFGRPADKDGLAGKVAEMKSLVNGGMAVDTALAVIGNHFVNSPEYNDTTNTNLHKSWVGLSNGDIVAEVYNNLFNRPAEADGIAFWTTAMANGLTLDQLVWTVARAAQPGDMPASQNITYAAQYFTDHMTAQQNASYKGFTASDYGRMYLNMVSGGDSTLADAAGQADTYIRLAAASGSSLMASGRVASDSGQLILQGSGGSDQFVLIEKVDSTKVLNFSGAEGDHLVLSHAFNGLNFANAADVLAHSHVENGNTVIDLGQGHAVTLVGVTALAAQDVVLV
jgi:hypothetical protein